MPAVKVRLLALLLVVPLPTGAQTTHEPPPVEVTQPTRVVTIEAEEAEDGGNVRFDYTVRYLSTTADAASIVQFEIGVAESGDPITEKPVALEGPPGWNAMAIPVSRSRPQTWRISWSCAHSGWDHRLKHQISPGQTVRGFRALVPRGAAGYATASYQVFVGGDRGVAPGGLSGRVSPRRK